MSPRGSRCVGPAPRVAAAILAAAFVATCSDRGASAAGAAPERIAIRVGACTLIGPPESAAALRALAERARVILPEIETDLGARFAADFRLFLIPAGALRDSELARLDAGAPSWAAGFLAPARRVGAIRIARAAQYPYGSLEAVLAHEATHMLLHDAVDRPLPLWFEEGVAMWEERGWSLRDMVIYSTSLLTADLPSLSDLDRDFHASEGEAQLAYAAAFAFTSRAARRHGAWFVRDVLREARSRPFEEAWRVVTGATLAQSEAAWRRDSLIRYRWIPVLTASSTLWIGITFLALAAGVRRRARTQAIRARWDEEERAEEESVEEGHGEEGRRMEEHGEKEHLAGEGAGEDSGPPGKE